jgi:hypothetical protein
VRVMNLKDEDLVSAVALVIDTGEANGGAETETVAAGAGENGLAPAEADDDAPGSSLDGAEPADD